MSSTRARYSAVDGAIDPLPDYAPSGGEFDEVIAPDGSVRPHWREFLDGFAALPDAERDRARGMAARLLRENSVTYVAQGDPEHRDRPWQLDLFPLLIEPSEWKAIEAGLIQRADLLNRILGDLYGPQTLLKAGKLPPSLVFGNPQFLNPCHGIAVPQNVHLHLLAFDIARAPDGRWWVLSDRTQAPSGAGYALENRLVASNSLPGLFAASNVQRLASFFARFSEHFLSLSRHDDPLAVLLSPGPGRTTYFEHAYLARYLGYSVVEGSDLTVRDDRLFLKTIDGLKPVDLVMRRVESEYCDPLELRTDSLLGVPGLVQAARTGQVVVANALGSGLVESDAFLSFLPGLCRHLLDEELKMPGVASWWCGQPQERAYVLDNLDRLIVRNVTMPKTILGPGQDRFIGAELSAAEREALRGRIGREGHKFIGQEPVALSTTPVWLDGQGLRPAHMTLRVYVAATADGYKVMPGGLTRVSEASISQAPLLEQSNISKDSWVLSDEPVDTFSLLTAPHNTLRLRRGSRDLPSRTADNLFWLGRYAERCEGTVRLLRSLLTRLHGESDLAAHPVALDRLVKLLVAQEHLSQRRARQAVAGGMGAVEAALGRVLFGRDTPDGLVSILGNVRRTANLVRERLSEDTWQILMELVETVEVSGPGDSLNVDEALQLLDRMIRNQAALNGMIMENMTRAYSWRFLDLGRRLERIRHMVRLIRNLAGRGDPEATGSLGLLLELADSTMTYRTRYKAVPRLVAALDLLMADETNPRSVLFQLNAFETHMSELPSDSSEAIISPIQRIATELHATLRLADMEALAGQSRRDKREKLERLTHKLEEGVKELADLIARTYFSHSMPQHVSGPQWVEMPS